MSTFEIGDKLRVLKDRPSFSDLMTGDIVTIIGKPEWTSDAWYVTGPNGEPAEGFEDRGWSVRERDLEKVVENVPEVGWYALLSGGDTVPLRVTKVATCRDGGLTDYFFEGRVQIYPAGLHRDEVYAWFKLTEVKVAPEEWVSPEPEVWEVGKSYVQKPSLWNEAGSIRFTAEHVYEDGDVAGIDGWNVKHVLIAAERENYEEQEDE